MTLKALKDWVPEPVSVLQAVAAHADGCARLRQMVRRFGWQP